MDDLGRTGRRDFGGGNRWGVGQDELLFELFDEHSSREEAVDAPAAFAVAADAEAAGRVKNHDADLA